MKRHYTERFNRSYAEAPPTVRRAFSKQVELLLQNLRHPSLRAKKIDETHDIWQARVNKSWRFLFQIRADTYLILDMFPHPK
jgi:mRNA-degrading endonuclease RelE of RelBE toxin-antitoxin system